MTRKKTFRATVSVLADHRLGIRLRKDLLEAVGWEPDMRLRLTPLSKKKLVVEVDE